MGVPMGVPVGLPSDSLVMQHSNGPAALQVQRQEQRLHARAVATVLLRRAACTVAATALALHDRKGEGGGEGPSVAALTPSFNSNYPPACRRGAK